MENLEKISPTSRTRYSRAVYQPAKALADEIYRREIRKTAPSEMLRILFTSGGTGAGKSTALAMLHAESDPSDQYDILVDGTLSDYTAARAKIRQPLALGHSVAIIHVHRAFAETVRMVVKRAIEMGRAVTLDNIAATHFRSAETLFKLAEEFGERIDLRVLENSGDKPARTISLAELASRRANSVDQLRKLATLCSSMNSTASKLTIPKSMKLSSKTVLAAKVQRPAATMQGKTLADRAVGRMVTGLNAAQRSGKFPKVY